MRYYLLAALTLSACQPLETQPGPQGPAGPPGPMGVMGTPGVGAETSNKDGTRIRVRQEYSVLTTEDGAAMESERTNVLYDTKLESICFPRQAEDLVYRCLPRGRDESIAPTFSDPKCTQRVVVSVPGLRYVNDGANVYRVTTELQGSAVYEKVGVCNRRMDLPRSGESVYDVSPMRPTEFARTLGLVRKLTP